MGNIELHTEFNDYYWDEFVNISRNGTLFHTKKFLSYHDSNKFKDCSLIFNKNNKIISVLPACIQNNMLISHSGSSFGGFVISKEVNISDIFNMIDMLSMFCRKNMITNIRMRTTPYIYNKMPCDELEFSMVYRGFKQEVLDLAYTINLNEYKYKDSTVRNIKNKNYDINIKFDDDNFDDFWKILIKNLNDKYQVSPTHTLEEIYKLKKLFPDKIILVGGYVNNKMISGVVLFIGNNLAFEVFYIAQDYEYQRNRCLSVVIDNVIKFGIFNNFKYVNLGISTEDRGNIINFGLCNFKSGFGARGVLKRTFCKEILL